MGPMGQYLGDANVINNRSRPLLMSVNEQEIPYAETA